MDKEQELKKLLSIFVEDDLDKLRGDPIMDEAINELERLSQDENIIRLYNEELEQQKIDKSIKEE